MYTFNQKTYDSIEAIPLEGLHTKQLLKLLRSTYHYDTRLRDEPEEKLVNFQKRLRDELAIREHVPDKQESRKLRQEKAKRGL